MRGMCCAPGDNRPLDTFSLHFSEEAGWKGLKGKHKVHTFLPQSDLKRLPVRNRIPHAPTGLLETKPTEPTIIYRWVLGVRKGRARAGKESVQGYSGTVVQCRAAAAAAAAGA
eukprot:5344077-Pyramimonas_sp.AAC.1